jgi:hypothetical protein
MQSKTTQRVYSVIAAALLVTSLGCMAGPGHGEIIGKRSTSISFTGFTVDPDETVRVYAKDWTTNSWHYLGSTTTDSAPYYEFGTSWYYWGTERVIPNKCWKKYGTGYFAEIKAAASGESLTTFEEGFYNYAEDYDDLEELYNEKAVGETAIIWANP